MFKYKNISCCNLHFFFSLARLEHMIRFEHKFVSIFIKDLVVTLDNLVMIELDFIGKRHMVVVAFKNVSINIKEFFFSIIIVFLY